MEVLSHTPNFKADLRTLNRNELVSLAKRSASDERRANAQLIRVLCEVTRRNLFLDMGYDSLFTFLKEELGYTGGTAARRVNAVYAALELPEIDQKIEKGEISLSNAARLNRFFRAEKLKGNGELKKEEKREALKAVENHSERESEGILAEKATTPKETIKYEEKSLSRKKHLLQFEVDETFYQELEEAKLILSHAVPSMKTSDLFQYLIRDLLKRKGAMRELYKKKRAIPDKGKLQKIALEQREQKKNREENPRESKETETTQSQLPLCNKSIQTKTLTFSSAPNRAGLRSSGTLQTSTSSPRTHTRYIKAKDKHALQTTRKEGCSYQDPQTGRRCCSRYRLQADHKIPFSKGGPTELENLQWLCARHNIAKGDKAG